MPLAPHEIILYESSVHIYTEHSTPQRLSIVFRLVALSAIFEHLVEKASGIRILVEGPPWKKIGLSA